LEAAPQTGNKIHNGVEVDADGRHVAYWVQSSAGESLDFFGTGSLTATRVPAFGVASGRRVAWLVYGSDRRHGTTRGEPLLALVLQSLKEVDRYRDATQRKAVINSMVAMFVKKTEDKPSTLPITGGAIRKGAATVTDIDGSTRRFNVADQIPGLVMQELQQGEEPVPFSTAGTDIQFAPFEEAVLRAIAWANEVPPEIYWMAFSNNYSASQAAINEFKTVLNKFVASFGAAVCQRVYAAWLLGSALTDRIPAAGLIEAWRAEDLEAVAAWESAAWHGIVKPSTDVKKQAAGTKMLVDEGWTTNARATRDFGGGKWTKNIRQLRRENELKAAALRPILELRAEYGDRAVDEQEVE
jgi:capsid protein